MDLLIRELSEEDLERGFLESLASLTSVDLTPAAARTVMQDRERLGIRTFVAVAGSSVVGTASLLIEKKFIHGGGLVGHIEDVAVHQDSQRRGIGTALVQHLTEIAREAGCYKVILDCFDHLVPFYERIGYKPFNRGLRADL